MDLVLSSEATLLDPPITQYLSILKLNILSDNKPVLLKLFTNSYKEQCSTDSDFLNSNNFSKKRRTYIWKETDKAYFVQHLQEEMNILETKLQNRTISTSKSDIDYFLKKVQNTFLKSANKVLKCKAIEAQKKNFQSEKKTKNGLIRLA